MNIEMIPFGTDKPLGDIPKIISSLNNLLRDTGAEGVRYMSAYPPDSPYSNYRRTGTLRRSWSFNITSSGKDLVGVIGSSSNTAPYNDYAQGENQARAMKSIGWRNVNDLQLELDKSFPSKLESIVDDNFKE